MKPAMKQNFLDKSMYLKIEKYGSLFMLECLQFIQMKEKTA